MDDPPHLLYQGELLLDNPCGYGDVRRRELRPWLQALLGELAPDATSFSVRFASDREMQRLNAGFRGKEGTTDVLSFPGDYSVETRRGQGRPLPLERAVGPEGRHLGDVVISVPAARRQAIARGDEVGRELRTLMLHGVLHCLGHDHETDDGTMERLERRLRRRWLDGSRGGRGRAAARPSPRESRVRRR